MKKALALILYALVFILSQMFFIPIMLVVWRKRMKGMTPRQKINYLFHYGL